MNRNEWMCNEISAWRAEGVIDEGLASDLLKRYTVRTARISWGAVISGGFGALLIGLGIIALFAANWDCFGRAARAVISLSPVALCGVIALIAAKKGAKTMVVWEPLGILWAISTGAAACLVAQTYQIGGSAPSLILFVALLILPISWVTRSNIVISCWPIFAIVWYFAKMFDDERSLTTFIEALALMALSLPGYIVFLRRKPGLAALCTVQAITGLVYLLGVAILANYCMHCNGSSAMVVFWICSAALGLIGLFFKLPVWPMIALLVAAFVCALSPFLSCRYLCLYIVSLLYAVIVAVVGICRVRLTYTNIGAVLLLWLVLTKFFSSEVSFTIKGIVLIVSGVALTMLNVALVKFKKRGAAK